jgi:predicted dehydrogenase
MKVAVLGCGSIGKRHATIFSNLGLELFVIDPDPEKRNSVALATNGVPLESPELLTDADIDLLVVASPNRFHRQGLETAINLGMHLLMEKPIDVDVTGLAHLVETFEQTGRVALVGSNWKFHPLFERLALELSSGRLGRVLSATIDCGQYLPDWHPWEDYRFGYSARNDLGGGVLLDSHEIEYAQWLLGPVVRVGALVGKLSDLEISTEDTASLTMLTATNVQIAMQLDYCSRLPRRRYWINTTDGSIKLDAIAGTLTIYDSARKSQTEVGLPQDYQVNDMYERQAQHLLEAIAGNVVSATPLSSGVRTLQVIVAAKESQLSGRFVEVASHVRV